MKVNIQKSKHGYLLELTVEPHGSQSLVMLFDDVHVVGQMVSLRCEGTHVAHVYYDIAKAVIDFMESEND